MDGAVVAVALLGVLVLLGIGLWLAAVVFVFIDATQRNASSPLLWALGVLCTGPFGLVAYLIDRPKARQVACRFCGHTILQTDVSCPYCGRVAQ